MNLGVDLSGNRYGYLYVLRKNGSCKKGITYECQCDCGNIITAKRADLVRGHKKSCGCMTQKMKTENRNNHNLSKTRLYRTYMGMIGRCYNPKLKRYKYYGQKGITVCPEWLGEKGFYSFSSWAIKNGYTEELTIDRKDNNLGYSPDNCRWVSQKKQQNNRTNNHYITYEGQTKTISEWAEYLDIPEYSIRNKLKRGSSDLDAIKECWGQHDTRSN